MKILSCLVAATSASHCIVTAQDSHAGNSTRSLAARMVCSTTYPSVVFRSYDIGTANANSPQLCVAACANTAKCMAWTWTSYNGGTCWLKFNIGLVFALPGATGGVVTTPSGAQCNVEEVRLYDSDVVSDDIGNVPKPGDSDCWVECAQNSQCEAWTWSDYNGGTCWLKTRNIKDVKAAPQMSSGFAVRPMLVSV